jgi:hypothetical protein
VQWVRIDDHMPIHRKVARLSDTAFRLHVSAICWSNRNRTDGAVPLVDLPMVLPGSRSLVRSARELVEAGLWRDANPDGWIIHDYLDYQPSKTTIEAMRDVKKTGGTLGAHRRWHEGRGIVVTDCGHCKPAGQ